MSTNNQNDLHGILAEFKNPKQLLDVAKMMSKSGNTKFDTYRPFPIHG
ncbi:MAG: quinol:electron acceptor oxidoreductase subunit ActD, partial [Balneolaceae bacterium]